MGQIERRAARRGDALEATFLADVSRDRDEPLERQIVERLRAAIGSGRLGGGTRLPPTRRLAADLGVARNTVAAAYEQLVADGYLVGARGAGTFVAGDATAPAARSATGPRTGAAADRAPSAALPQGEPGLVQLGACCPADEPFPRAAWRRAFARAASALPGGDDGAPAGEWRLRAAIAAYLARARALSVAPEAVVVTAGAVQGIALLARLLLAPGDAVAFEDPGYTLAREALTRAGARILPVPVDADGIVVDALPEGAGAPRLVYVTPSHQFPLGGRLSLSRRRALLDWAARNGALVVEDDYDGEFRYDAAPLPPLASLPGAERVAYVGTFSKTLTPTLRLGFVACADPRLVAGLTELRASGDNHTPSLTQNAVATLIEDGTLTRHVARMRRVYAARRAAVQDALAPIADRAPLRGLSAGLHAWLDLGDAERVAAIRAAMRRHGIALTPVDAFAVRPQTAPQGIVLGYGALAPVEAARLCGRLRSELDAIDAGAARAT